MIKIDLCEEHWLLLEADSNVESFVLHPGLSGDEPVLNTELGDVDAVVRLRTGQVEWRYVKFRTELRSDDLPLISPDAANGAPLSHRVVTDELLTQHGLLIENFRGVVAAQARTAEFPPVAESDYVAALLRRDGRVVLGDLIDGLDPCRASLMLSGAFALLTSGVARSDLDVARLSTRTQLWARV